MKLQLEIATEGQDITIKGAAVLPFDKEAWKRRIGIWSYRVLIAILSAGQRNVTAEFDLRRSARLRTDAL